VQRREYEQAFGTDPGIAYFRDEYDDPRLNWDLRDGDWEAFPGLQLIDTRGHTQGHQSAGGSSAAKWRLRSAPSTRVTCRKHSTRKSSPAKRATTRRRYAPYSTSKPFEAETQGTRLLFHDPQADPDDAAEARSVYR